MTRSHTARVVVYSTDACPFCEGAKTLLSKRGVPYTEIKKNRSVEDRDELVQATGGLSFPQVVIDNKAIGGFEELRALDRAGKLDRLLLPPD